MRFNFIFLAIHSESAQQSVRSSFGEMRLAVPNYIQAFWTWTAERSN